MAKQTVDGVVIEALTIHADGSGAPAVARVDGFAFAFDTLGAVKGHRIDGRNGTSRRARLIAANRAERAYLKARDAALPTGWLELNAAMYAA